MKLMLKIFLSYLHLLTMNIFLFQWHFHIVKYVAVRSVSVSVNEIFVHMDTHLSNRWICNDKNSTIYWFYTSKDIVVE